MTIRVEPIFRWILTCHACHAALSYDAADVQTSPSTDDNIQCPACKSFNPVPDVGQRIPFKPTVFAW